MSIQHRRNTFSKQPNSCRTSIIEINNDKYVPTFEEDINADKIIKADSFMNYNEFFENFLIKNKPCIFNADITNNWPSKRNWNNNNIPNFEWLKESFGDCKVPIADCNKRYFNAQHKDDMLIKGYIDYWIAYRKCNYSNSMPLLYLKDWHCIKSYSNTSIYDVPKFFASDWLNEYYIAHPHLNDDYMFVYMGPKGTWTPFHVDVFTSYSWSANIVGKKRWLLFPPGQEKYLKNVNGDLMYDITLAELDNISKCTHSCNKTLKSIEIIQEVGQIIFVPSGWHHQVWNLEDTISINHNWLNGCNIRNIWNSLKKELAAVIKEIEDCKEMDDWIMHCQKMLKASFGMNYFEFYDFLAFIAEKRLNFIIHNIPVKSFDKWQLGKTHCLFDLHQIKFVLESLMKDANEKGLNTFLWKENEIQTLLDKINIRRNVSDNIKV